MGWPLSKPAIHALRLLRPLSIGFPFVQRVAALRGQSDRQIAWYRDALSIIHVSPVAVPLRRHVVLRLNRELCCFLASGGWREQAYNTITERGQRLWGGQPARGRGIASCHRIASPAV